jgi:hypothetical protein
MARNEAARKDEAETAKHMSDRLEDIRAHRAKRARKRKGSYVTSSSSSSSEEEDPQEEEYLVYQEDVCTDVLEGIELTARARGEDPKTGEPTVELPESL